MKLKVYNPKELPETETPVYLALVQQDDGVLVEAQDAEGRHIPGGNLLKFNNDGTIRRCICIMPKLGFKLDPNGSIECGSITPGLGFRTD